MKKEVYFGADVTKNYRKTTINDFVIFCKKNPVIERVHNEQLFNRKFEFFFEILDDNPFELIFITNITSYMEKEYNVNITSEHEILFPLLTLNSLVYYYHDLQDLISKKNEITNYFNSFKESSNWLYLYFYLNFIENMLYPDSERSKKIQKFLICQCRKYIMNCFFNNQITPLVLYHLFLDVSLRKVDIHKQIDEYSKQSPNDKKTSIEKMTILKKK